MEKIFDIAKDSEQKWGVIAKTIDRNNENLYYYSNPTSGVIEKNDNDKIFLLAVTSLWLEVLDESISLPDKLYCTYLGNSSGNYKTVVRFDDASGKTYFSKTYSDGPKSGMEELQIYAASASGVSGKFLLHVIVNWDSITDQYLQPNTEINTSSLNRSEVTSKLSKKDKISSLETRISTIENRDDNLYGKTILCFGDSITEMADAYKLRYSDYMQDIYQCKVYNVGIGGTQIRQRTNPVEIPTSSNQAYAALDIINLVKAACSGDFTIQENAAEYLKNNTSDDNTAIVQILKSVDWDSVDAVTVFAGTNDWPSYSATLGESGSTDIGKTLGAVNEIIRLLSSTYPHVKIYWFTPIVRYSSYSISEWDDRYWSDRMGSSEQPYLPQSGSNEPNTSDSLKNGTLKDFSEAIENEVRLNHIPCCDMYNTLGWNKYNFSQYFNDSDGTHPKKGFKEIAKKIASFLIANKTF